MTFLSAVNTMVRHGQPRPIRIHNHKQKQEGSSVPTHSSINSGQAKVSGETWQSGSALNTIAGFRAGTRGDLLQTVQQYYDTTDRTAADPLQRTLIKATKEFSRFLEAAQGVKSEIQQLPDDSAKLAGVKDCSGAMLEVTGEPGSGNAGHELTKQLFRVVRHALDDKRTGINDAFDGLRALVNLKRPAKAINPPSSGLADILENISRARSNLHVPDMHEPQSSNLPPGPDLLAQKRLGTKMDKFVLSQMSNLTDDADKARIQTVRRQLDLIV